MPKYLFHGSYTAQGLKGLVKEGGSGRRKAAEQHMESVGGRLETAYYAFGGDDFYLIADLPDAASAAAASLAANAAGAITMKTVALLTAEEIDEAVQKSVDYRPPGQ